MTDCLKKVMSLKRDNSLKCENCNKKGGMTTTTYLKHAPAQMIVKLCRAMPNGKILTKVTIPTECVDLSVCQRGAIRGDPAGSSYHLTGVIKHRGKE